MYYVPSEMYFYAKIYFVYEIKLVEKVGVLPGPISRLDR